MKINYPFTFLINLFIASLFWRCEFGKENYILDHTYMEKHTELRWDQDSSILIFSGNSDFSTKPLKLTSGKHTIIFRAKGTSANNALPHFKIILGDFTLKDMEVKEGMNDYAVNFELPKTIESPLRFIFDNDYNDALGDRNIFLFFPVSVLLYRTYLIEKLAI